MLVTFFGYPRSAHAGKRGHKVRFPGLLASSVAISLLSFANAAISEETPECSTQTRLCDQAEALLRQCQDRKLDCTLINEQMLGVCANKATACYQQPTYSNTFGTSIGSEASKPKEFTVPNEFEVGGENMSGFGAIAYSPSKRVWGDAYGYAARRDAEKRAFAECRNQQASDCQLAISFYRQCGAVAGDENGAWGSGLSSIPKQAVRDALSACAGKGGKDCELERVTCTR